jgi:hypothetical protein
MARARDADARQMIEQPGGSSTLPIEGGHDDECRQRCQ